MITSGKRSQNGFKLFSLPSHFIKLVFLFSLSHLCLSLSIQFSHFLLSLSLSLSLAFLTLVVIGGAMAHGGCGGWWLGWMGWDRGGVGWGWSRVGGLRPTRVAWVGVARVEVGLGWVGYESAVMGWDRVGFGCGGWDGGLWQLWWWVVVVWSLEVVPRFFCV